MNAEILPIRGKYYGTIVRISDPQDPGRILDLKIWGAPGDQSPSDQELAPFTRQDWEENVLVPDTGWDSDTLVPIREAEIVDPGHYQSVADLELAEIIANAVEGNYPT